MTKSEAFQVGRKVYHTVFREWGEGIVVNYRYKDNLGYKTARKVLVSWADYKEPMWMRLAEIRATPKPVYKNKMVKLRMELKKRKSQ